MSRVSSFTPSPLSGIKNQRLRDIKCHLQNGRIPKDRDFCQLLGFISLFHYAAEQYGVWLEIADPTTDEIVILDALHHVWRRHATTMYDRNSINVKEKFDDVQMSDTPPLYWYDNTLAIHIMAHHHETVPRFKCSGCKKRYVNQHNRLRCESSHPIVHGRMQSTSSQYGAMQVTKWWDGLSYEERYAVVGAESIRHGMEAPIYHTIEDTKGRLLLELLQEQMEGTALCRQINAVPQIPMDVKSAGPYRVCKRLLELYVSWCSRTLLADEHNQVIKTATKAKQRRLKALMKKAPVSDHAFRQLTEFADSLSWTTMQDEEPVLERVVQPVVDHENVTRSAV
jgi:hypothetical protein